MKGDLTEGDSLSIAIVDTRFPDKYGRQVTEAQDGELASLGVNVVSGMARGIDSMVQETAPKRGGRTIAVLGSGIDVICPPGKLKTIQIYFRARHNALRIPYRQFPSPSKFP
jgi:DNA processing protein